MPAPSSKTRWYAYVLLSGGDGPRAARSYIGVAVDVERRARQHNGELAGGARATRAGRPWRIAKIYGPFVDRGAAQAVEYQLKQRRGAAARLEPLPGAGRALTRVPRSGRSRTGC